MMLLHKKPKPQKGDYRIVRKFCILPHEIDELTSAWLENVYRVDKFSSIESGWFMVGKYYFLTQEDAKKYIDEEKKKHEDKHWHKGNTNA